MFGDCQTIWTGCSRDGNVVVDVDKYVYVDQDVYELDSRVREDTLTQ